MPEQWLPVVGYEGLYEVSDQGRVRSVERLVRSRFGYRRIGPKILKQDAREYFRVGLSKNAKLKTLCVHALMLTAFKGPPPVKGMVTRHLDGEHFHNNLSNLVWGTQAENMADKKRHGVEPYGEACYNAKMTNHSVRLLRKLFSHGSTIKGLARQFGIDRRTARRIIRREGWKHV